MSDVQIYHNPLCSKSRETLALLHSRGIHPHVVLYMESPPAVATLQELLKALGFRSARQLMRTKEVLYQQLGLADETLNETQLCEAMAAHPRLIERPLVIAGCKARLGRPPEQVLDII